MKSRRTYEIQGWSGEGEEEGEGEEGGQKKKHSSVN